MGNIKFFVLIFISLIFGCNQKSDKSKVTRDNESDVIESAILIDDLVKDPEAYVGKVVEVEGLVTHVCKHSGKRLHLTSTTTNEMIRVEATGDIIRFERELEGSDVRIKGLVQKQVIDEDYLAKWDNEISNKSGSHEHGQDDPDSELLTSMRMRLKNSGQDQLVTYWVDGTSFEVD